MHTSIHKEYIIYSLEITIFKIMCRIIMIQIRSNVLETYFFIKWIGINCLLLIQWNQREYFGKGAISLVWIITYLFYPLFGRITLRYHCHFLNCSWPCISSDCKSDPGLKLFYTNCVGCSPGQIKSQKYCNW